MDKLISEIREIAEHNILDWVDGLCMSASFEDELTGLFSDYHILPKTGDSGYGLVITNQYPEPIFQGNTFITRKELKEFTSLNGWDGDNVKPIFWVEIKEDDNG